MGLGGQNGDFQVSPKYVMGGYSKLVTKGIKSIRPPIPKKMNKKVVKDYHFECF